jgi:O-antigen ligase
MDKFTLIIGLVGIILLVVAIVVIIAAIISLIKKKTTFRKFMSSFIVFLILFAFATSFIYLSLFLQTFSRYTSEHMLKRKLIQLK